MANQAGGAISVQGHAVSTFLIEESVFESNVIETSVDAAGIDATVRLNTGTFAIGSESGYMSPIWRIDDGRA